jgi:hypothetical protein
MTRAYASCVRQHASFSACASCPGLPLSIWPTPFDTYPTFECDHTTNAAIILGCRCLSNLQYTFFAYCTCATFPVFSALKVPEMSQERRGDERVEDAGREDAPRREEDRAEDGDRRRRDDGEREGNGERREARGGEERRGGDRGGDRPRFSLIVRNLERSITPDDLRREFEVFGDMRDVVSGSNASRAPRVHGHK